MKSLLSGERIYLSSFHEKDTAKIKDWNDHEELQRLLDALPYKPKTDEEVKKWINDSGSNFIRFAVRLRENDEIIGYAEIEGILWSHRVGWITIAIGDKSYWGNGYGKEILQRLLAYGFNELNLHRLQLTVFDYNKRAINLYESLGFKQEGTFREFLRRDGKRHNMLLYGLLHSEWKN
jgi:RimJ/RimL family protein N-acetyltransferase